MSGDEEENAAELKIGEDPVLEGQVPDELRGGHHPGAQVRADPADVGRRPGLQVSQVFEKSLHYVKRFSRYKNPDAVRRVRETLSRYGLAELELCTLGNLCPDTAYEATALVPSLRSGGRFQPGDPGNDKIDKMLNDLSLIKKFE